MSVTARELAGILGISPAAVSVALNNRPGVSDDTRKKVLDAAKKYGCKSGIARAKEVKQKVISFVLFKKSGGTVVDNTPFFSALTEGIAARCREHGFSLDIRYVYESKNLSSDLEELINSNHEGIILLATEMKAEDFKHFENINTPLVVLDTYFENISMDYVLINNIQGAFLAANTLIKTRGKQPGYLHSSYSIGNFQERSDGFYKAIRSNNMSPSKSIVHLLEPTFEGAYSDMSKLLDQGAALADCYFADNDMIAAGAMRAFKEHGYKIPKDVAFIGFDNAFPSNLTSPQLTTIDVQKQVMGKLAVDRLVYILSETNTVPVKIQLLTSLKEGASL